MKKSQEDETFVVRITNKFFSNAGYAISYAPWWFIVGSSVATIFLAGKIPFTPMHNDIADFTPLDARARTELEKYRGFFDRGEPKAIYVFCTAKDGDMLSIHHLNHTVQVMDKVAGDLYLETSNGAKSFDEYCKGFCTVNEPVRHFYSGMLISNEYGNESRHLDLGYPVTTVLGSKLFMDPNFFGVKIAVRDSDGVERVVSVAEQQTQLAHQEVNNMREISLVVLQFRMEVASDVTEENLKLYEEEIINYFEKSYLSPYINVLVLTDSFITSEIVRAGLTLLPFLVIGFTIMVIFSCLTFTIGGLIMKQMSYYKMILAWMACVCPFMACGATLGGMFWIGMRFGSILCVTPFLVLAIGVDDAYLMVNAWQRITARRRKSKVKDVEVEVRERIVEMLVDVGPSVGITTVTNALAFGMGALSPTPEIQLFSIGNALAITIDFFFQLTVFGALMVLLGRYEISKEVQTEENYSTEKRFETDCSHPEKRTQTTRFIESYCAFLSNKIVSSIVLAVLAVYWYLCIVGTLNVKAELKPERLFLQNSDISKVFTQRDEFITPYYSVCWVLVGSPGDITNPLQTKRLHQLLNEFEKLPSSVGSYATKFWLRDYEDFMKQSEELDIPEEYDDVATAITFTQNGRYHSYNYGQPLNTTPNVRMRPTLK